jgi:hypothetical protein
MGLVILEIEGFTKRELQAWDWDELVDEPGHTVSVNAFNDPAELRQAVLDAPRPTETGSRYWVIDNPMRGEPSLPHPDACQDGPGPYVLPIVDENYGGVIGWASSTENAERIVAALTKADE